MPSLRELQRRVMDAVLPAATDRACVDGIFAILDGPTGRAAAGVAAYRNTVRGNFVDALHSTYPVIWRLVGEDYFRQLAREYSGVQPSRSGDLLHAGACFPAFLAERHGQDRFRYLSDVARFEWLVQETLLAPDHAPLDLGKLAAVAPADYETLGFVLHPALRLFDSAYPVHRIWEVNVGTEAQPEVLDLSLGGDRIAIMRQGWQLKFHTLRPGEWCLLHALMGGATFAAAADDGERHDGADFDASRALQRFVAMEAIVDCRLRF